MSYLTIYLNLKNQWEMAFVILDLMQISIKKPQ